MKFRHKNIFPHRQANKLKMVEEIGLSFSFEVTHEGNQWKLSYPRGHMEQVDRPFSEMK